MKAIFGDMEFGSFVINGDSFPICIICNVQAVMEVPDEGVADELLKQYGGYVIPELTDCEIVYTPGAWSAITN